MPDREPRAHYSVIFGVCSAQCLQIHNRYLLHLVYFQELNNLSDGGQFALTEEIASVVVHLCTVAPKEVFLRAFDQAGTVVAEFGLRLLLLPLFHQFLSVQYIVFLAVGQLLSQWVSLRLFSRGWGIQVQVVLQVSLSHLCRSGFHKMIVIVLM
jgi:hypothetical protein